MLHRYNATKVETVRQNNLEKHHFYANFTATNYIYSLLSMKKLHFLILALAISATCMAQNQAKHSTFYYQRATLFDALPTDTTDIVMLGNSITNGAEWFELFNDPRVKNRGISGDTWEGVYDRLDYLLKGQPAKIFLLIGVNNVSRGHSVDSIAGGVEKIVKRIRKESPRTRLYVQSMLPVNDCYGMFGGHTSRADSVPLINQRYRNIAAENGATFIDLYSSFADPETGKMNPQYTNDGLHLLGSGYLVWRDLILPYIKE